MFDWTSFARRSHRSSLGASLVALCVGGCGALRADDAFTAPPAFETRDRGSPDEIVFAEIQGRRDTDPHAHRVIQRLRPRWLLGRGQNNLSDPDAAFPIVYLDHVRHGDIRTLFSIPSNVLRRIEYIGPADATTRWGTGHPGGVIHVHTGRGP